MVTTLRVWAALLFALALVQGPGGCSRPQEPPWNVGAVVGQPIDAVRKTLGAPQQEALPPPSTVPVVPSPTAQSAWQSGDNTLTATWKTGNRRVLSWTLTRPDADAVSEDNKALLLKPGRLAEGDPRYSVDWIEASDRPLFYSGARIVPTPKTHAVVLRVTGGTALISVNYAISGPQSQGETVMTLAPWEFTANVPDDTQISLQSGVLRGVGGGGTTDMKVEILADGKVVASDASMGRAVACQFEL